MSEDWVSYKLKDLVKISSGGTPRKANSEYWGGDIPWISASSMNGYFYSDSDLKITRLGLENGTRLAPKDSILLLVRGSILHQKIQVGLTTKDVSFNQDVKCLQVKNEIIEPLFLLFWFKAYERQLLAKVESTGIGAGKIDTSILKDLDVKIPPKNERIWLTKIFHELTRKIELNRKMNETLEGMAQALFKSWFVDFDPVLDNALAAGNPIPEALQSKAEGRKAMLARHSAHDAESPDQNPGTPLIYANPELAQQFPDRFTFNETLNKWIPEGWGVEKLGTKFYVKGGYAYKSKDFVENDGISVIKIKSIQADKTIDKSDLSKVETSIAMQRPEYHLGDGDILMAMTGATVGKIGILVKNDEEVIALNQRVAKFYSKSKHTDSMWFVFCFFNEQRNMDFIINTAQGSAQPNISASEIMSAPVAFPPQPIMDNFEFFVDPSFSKIIQNQKETETVTKLRDTLLPQLISGKVRLPEEYVGEFGGLNLEV